MELEVSFKNFQLILALQLVKKLKLNPATQDTYPDIQSY